MIDTLIPEDVLSVLERSKLLVYSACRRACRSGVVLHVGAMYPHAKEGKKPLSPDKNKKLRVWAKQRLRKLGYKCKVRSFVHPYSGEKDINDFRIKILVEEED